MAAESPTAIIPGVGEFVSVGGIAVGGTLLGALRGLSQPLRRRPDRGRRHAPAGRQGRTDVGLGRGLSAGARRRARADGPQLPGAGRPALRELAHLRERGIVSANTATPSNPSYVALCRAVARPARARRYECNEAAKRSPRCRPASATYSETVRPASNPSPATTSSSTSRGTGASVVIAITASLSSPPGASSG